MGARAAVVRPLYTRRHRESRPPGSRVG